MADDNTATDSTVTDTDNTDFVAPVTDEESDVDSGTLLTNDKGVGSTQSTPEVIEYTDFKMMEGLTLNSDLMDKVTPIFKESGLSQENAQKFVDLYSQQELDRDDNSAKAFEDLKTSWATDAKNDAEIGGDNFEESIAAAKSAFKQFGNDALFELFDSYGIGNHPEVIRLGKSINALVKEDQPLGSTDAVAPKTNRLNTLYPND